jgi:pyruvate formate lyase activating enzyme
VAFTYNDPVIFHEYAIDVAQACRERGVRTVAVTAGYQCAEPRAEFYRHMDAANVDLKGFSDRFYRDLCAGALEPILDTLRYVHHETDVWLEITTLLIPGWNDGDAELDALTRWVTSELGPEVPVHFTAFHPDWRMLETPATPAATLTRARRIGRANGLQHVYTGNVRDLAGGTTLCARCGGTLIVRDGYTLTNWRLTDGATCPDCGASVAGVFEPVPGTWGSRRAPVRLAS